MTVYSPKGRNTGASVVVFPGGGYNVLAIDLEGTEACDWLMFQGHHMRAPEIPRAVCEIRAVPELSDGIARCTENGRTVALPRSGLAYRSAQDRRARLFGQGGHMVAAMSTQFEKRLYPAVDAADKESCRPDFAVALYPGHLARQFELNPDIHVTSQTPPTFLLHGR